MSYINRCRIDALMQLDDFTSHLYTQLRIQIGQWFIHQEYLRIADDGTPQRNTLTLTAG